MAGHGIAPCANLRKRRLLGSQGSRIQCDSEVIAMADATHAGPDSPAGRSASPEGIDDMLAAMLAQAGDAVFALDLDGRLMPAANRKFEAETGYAIADVAGRHFSSLLADGEANRIKPLFDRAVRGEAFESIEVEIVQRTGERVWAEVSAAPLYWQGRTAGIVCVGRNATRRMRNLIDVVRLERLHEATVNAVRTGIVVLTSDLTVSAWNAYMEEWLCIGRSTAVGAHVSELFPGLWDDGLGDWIRTALRSGEPHAVSSWRHESHCDPGTTRYVDLRVQAMDSPSDGERVGLLVFEDVTDRVSLEQERITSERLRAVAETAAKANHEINNPLAALLGNVELLQRTPGLDADCQRRLSRIVESVERVVEVVRGLAEIARPAVDAVPPPPARERSAAPAP
jgi:PAS domain S-box-containing protein